MKRPSTRRSALRAGNRAGLLWGEGQPVFLKGLAYDAAHSYSVRAVPSRWLGVYIKAFVKAAAYVHTPS